ncbi:nuclear transport factor 2 family protein [Spirosoma areae]
MKRSIFLVTLLMQAAICVSGQSTDEKAVRKTLDELAIAMRNKDVAELDRIYAIDYTFVSPSSGVLSNKSERIAAVKSGKPLEYLAYEDKKVRIYGKTAVVTTTVKSKYASQDSTQSKATLTMVKNNGRWQIVAGHATPIATNQAGQKLN